MTHSIIRAILLFVLLSSAVDLSAQTLLRGNKKMVLDKSMIYEFYIPGDGFTGDEKCCAFSVLRAMILENKTDSLSLQLKTFFSKDKFGGASIETYLSENRVSNPQLYSIAKDDILYIKKINSYKSFKKKKDVGRLGALLMFSGLFTMSSALLVSGESNRERLFLTGGAQMAVGIVTYNLAKPKKYYLKRRDDPWRMQ